MKKMLILALALLLWGCTPYAFAANKKIITTSVEDALLSGQISQEEYESLQKISGLRPGEGTIVTAAQTAANDSMREAWRNGTEAHEQPVHVVTAPDGAVALAQNVPRQIVMLPNRELGLSGGTQITVIQAAQPTSVPTPPPTPDPNKVIVRSNITEQEISATVAISGDPGSEQLAAVETVSTNHKDLAEEMLDLAWTKVLARTLLVIPLTVVPFLAVCFAFLYLMRKIKLEETKFAEKCINGRIDK